MPSIQGPTPPSGPEGITPQYRRTEAFQKAGKTDPNDKVQISELARWKAKLAELPPIREELVAEVCQKIEDGTYETEEKIRVTCDRIIEDLSEQL